MPNKKLTVAVLAGGDSAERKISQLSGQAVAWVCRELGYKVLELDPAKDLANLIRLKKKIDVVFPALHGRGGEDGAIQGLLELLDLPYVGSSVLASATAFDKSVTRQVYRQAKLPIARGFVVTKKNSQSEISNLQLKMLLPYFVKPVTEGSSYGAGIVRKRSELLPALKKAWRYGGQALVEEFLVGTEITVGVLEAKVGLQALPIVEICPLQGWFNLKAKYDAKLCAEIVPARISARLTRQAQSFALKAHTALKLRHLSRTDMIIRKNKIYLLETNVLPGFTSNSLFPKMALSAGYSFSGLIAHLLKLARSLL